MKTETRIPYNGERVIVTNDGDEYKKGDRGTVKGFGIGFGTVFVQLDKWSAEEMKSMFGYAVIYEGEYEVLIDED